MTSAPDLIASADAVLLDFDGPLTALMPPPFNARAADAARSALNDLELPEAIREGTDHLAVLRFVWRTHPQRLADAEAACLTAEVEAALTSEPTPGAHDFLSACRTAGKPAAIVSNNSGEAVHAYLRAHALQGDVRAVVGRPPGRPDLMKPDAHGLNVACAALSVAHHRAVMIGDSLTDVFAAHAVGMPVIGYGKTAKRAEELGHAGADAVVLTMSTLRDGLAV